MQARQVVAIVAVIALVALAVVAILYPIDYTICNSCKNSQTSFDTTFTWSWNFPISVSYRGSWNLAYSGENGTTTYNNVTGNLNGTGNYATTVTLYGLGYSQRELCVNATKLDSQNLTLTLYVFDTNKSTSASNPTVGDCATAGS